MGDLARLEESFLASHFGRWGLALAGKARGEDAGHDRLQGPGSVRRRAPRELREQPQSHPESGPQ